MDQLEPGMKVECIDDDNRGATNIGCPLGIRRGLIYTVRAVNVPKHPLVTRVTADEAGAILLVEVRRPHDVPFAANRFRPIRRRHGRRMTEDEAKTKWCPFARGVSDNGGNRMAYGSHGDGPAEDDYTQEMAAMYPCIASACMAWRWVPSAEETLIGGIRRYRNETGASLAAAKEYVETHPEYLKNNAPTEGFCGLSGKP